MAITWGLDNDILHSEQVLFLNATRIFSNQSSNTIAARMDSHIKKVIRFYDTHPISEKQVLDKLAKDGIDPSHLSVDLLQGYDQDHLGGAAATDVIARLGRIDETTHVLDVCCGLGGPTRYLAHNYGCRVTGIDLNKNRVEGASRMTKMVELESLLTFQFVNALSNGLSDDAFDVLVSQEAFCHIPDKPLLMSECVRVLKPGGRMVFTDILTCAGMTQPVQERLQREMAFTELSSLEGYRELLEERNCSMTEVEDLSDDWAQILIERLAMYRSLKDQTVERFGNEHFKKWDKAYSFFVGLYSSGELGGGRFLAQKIN